MVILADIERTFLQIVIKYDERDATRFLWLKNITKADVSDDNTNIYCLCRVPFGLICSPFLLGVTLKFQEGTPLALSVMNNIYDNVLIGADNSEEAYNIYQKAKEIFKGISMNLHKWDSTISEFSSTWREICDG